MHELSLAQSLLSTANTIAKKNNAQKITKIYIKIGQFALVMEDQLRFSFDIMKSEYETTVGSEIAISIEEGILECRDCDYRGTAAMDTDEMTYGLVSLFTCPECQSYSTDIISGNETFIDKIDIAKPSE